jgi:hypothetical protein
VPEGLGPSGTQSSISGGYHLVDPTGELIQADDKGKGPATEYDPFDDDAPVLSESESSFVVVQSNSAGSSAETGSALLPLGETTKEASTSLQEPAPEEKVDDNTAEHPSSIQSHQSSEHPPKVLEDRIAEDDTTSEHSMESAVIVLPSSAEVIEELLRLAMSSDMRDPDALSDDAEGEAVFSVGCTEDAENPESVEGHRAGESPDGSFYDVAETTAEEGEPHLHRLYDKDLASPLKAASTASTASTTSEEEEKREQILELSIAQLVEELTLASSLNADSSTPSASIAQCTSVSPFQAATVVPSADVASLTPHPGLIANAVPTGAGADTEERSDSTQEPAPSSSEDLEEAVSVLVFERPDSLTQPDASEGAPPGEVLSRPSAGVEITHTGAWHELEDGHHPSDITAAPSYESQTEELPPASELDASSLENSKASTDFDVAHTGAWEPVELPSSEDVDVEEPAAAAPLEETPAEEVASAVVSVREDAKDAPAEVVASAVVSVHEVTRDAPAEQKQQPAIPTTDDPLPTCPPSPSPPTQLHDTLPNPETTALPPLTIPRPITPSTDTLHIALRLSPDWRTPPPALDVATLPQTPLLTSILTHNLAHLRTLLSLPDTNPNHPSTHPPITIAITLNQPALVRLLLTRRDLNLNLPLTPSPLLLSLTNPYILQLLLDRNDLDLNRAPTLLTAVEHGTDINVPRMLLARHDLDCNRADDDGRTALMAAVERRDAAVLEMVLRRGDVDLNRSDHAGRTALGMAVEGAWEEGVEALVRRGAATGC